MLFLKKKKEKDQKEGDEKGKVDSILLTAECTLVSRAAFQLVASLPQIVCVKQLLDAQWLFRWSSFEPHDCKRSFSNPGRGSSSPAGKGTSELPFTHLPLYVSAQKPLPALWGMNSKDAERARPIALARDKHEGGRCCATYPQNTASATPAWSIIPVQHSLATLQ